MEKSNWMNQVGGYLLKWLIMLMMEWCIIKLTELGNDFFGREEDWDGKYRIVIWDIPEVNRRVRDLFRRKLREWEFVSLQKSVWVSRKNVTKKINKLINELELSKLIIVIETNDKVLDKLFESIVNTKK